MNPGAPVPNNTGHPTRPGIRPLNKVHNQVPVPGFPITSNARFPMPVSRSGVLLPQELITAMAQQGQMMPQTGKIPLGPFGDGGVNPYNAFTAPEFFMSPRTNGLPVGPPLMDLDISSSNFMKAMKFDAMSGATDDVLLASAGSSHWNPKLQGMNPKMEDNDEREDEEDYSQYSMSEDGDFMDRSMEPNPDLLEQQQAKAQAQLIGRFKQLREWQMSQQELLMKQQQDQLLLLKEEQSRVQKMIVKQRENQWGGTGPPPAATNASPPRSPHRKPPRPPQSSLPQAIAQGTLAKARMNVVTETVRGVDNCSELDAGINLEAIPRPATPQHMMRGRPVPNIMSGPNTPLEYLEHGNPNLDSDSNTQPSGTPFEDGIARLADTASECSEAPAYFESSSSQNIHVDPENIPDEQDRRRSLDRYGPPIPFPRAKLKDGDSPQLDGYDQVPTSMQAMRMPFRPQVSSNVNIPQNFFPDQLRQVMLGGNPNMQNPTWQNILSSNNMRMPGLIPNGQQPYVESDHRNEQFRDSRGFDSREVSEPTAAEEYDGDSEGFNVQGDEEQEEYEMEDEEDLSQELEETQEEQAADLDDLPVGGTTKTFEQLLEEELRKEEEKLKSSEVRISPQHTSRSPPKKTFLRRGEGIARFDRKQKPVSKPIHKHKKGSLPMKQPVKTTTHPVKTADNRVSKKPVPNAQPNKKDPQHQPKAKSSPPSKLKLKPPVARKSHSPKAVPHKSKNIPEMVPNAKAAAKPSSQPPPQTRAPKDSVGETSFQQCMQNRQKGEQVETEELEEFEILEQYADDNASFLSNVSAVNKVLSKDKTVKDKDRLSGSSDQGVLTEETESESESDGYETDDSSDDSQDQTLEHSSPQKNSNSSTSVQTNSSPITNHQNGLKAIQRKVSSLGNRSPQKDSYHNFAEEQVNHNVVLQSEHSNYKNNQTGVNSIEIAQPAISNENDEDSSEFSESDSEEEINVRDIIMQSKLNKPAATSEGVSSDTDNFKVQITKEQHPTQSATINPNQLLSNKSTSQPSPVPSSSLQQKEKDKGLDFGDEDEWGEAESEGSKSKSPAKSQGPVIKSKVLQEETSGNVDGDATPPTSKLVSKLFPKLKTEKPKTQLTEQQEQKLSQARDAALGEGVQSKLLRDKLAELEREIERFRRENANLDNLRKEREQGLEHIKKEMSEFEKQKAEELNRLQAYKEEESKKLKKERKLFDQYQKASRAMPDKKEREEIENLKSQLSELQEQLRMKEQRWTASTTRLRDRLEHLEQENTELKEEVKILEKKRLEAWQQKEANKKEDNRQPAVAPLPQLSSFTPYMPPSLHGAIPDTGFLRDNILKLSHNTDTESELPDSASQSGNHSAEDKIAALTAMEATGPAKKQHLTSSPSHPHSVVPEISTTAPVPMKSSTASNGTSNDVRKTAVASNISHAVDTGDGKYEEMQHTDGKLERIYTNGAREILFSNGTRKQVSSDGQSIIVSFFNGDIKQIMPDQRVIYYYADAETTHTNYPDGLEIIHFPNNQTEKHYPDGTREITFPDQIIKYLFPSGVEESIFHDGTVIRIEQNGDKVMEFPNGQREVHTSQYKRREYPDGTVKTVYPDGRQETRYSSGRIRVKDHEGNIIVDRRV